MPKQSKSQLAARIAVLSQEIKKTAQVYNSPSYKATIAVIGTDNKGEKFQHVITVTDSDPDGVHFFNMYAATLCADRMILQTELDKLTKKELI